MTQKDKSQEKHEDDKESNSFRFMTNNCYGGFFTARIMNEIDKQHRYDDVYMNMAERFAMLSYAKRCKVGCIIVSPQGQIISQGYNGMPSGFNNQCEYEDKEGNLITREEVLHAESNAITKCAKCGIPTNGSTLYVTLSPCVECAKLIIQSGIQRVVYGTEYRNTKGLELLKSCNVRVDFLKLEQNKKP